MTILVEGFDSDAISLAGFLAAEGHTVRLAGAGAEPPDAVRLRELGVHVESHADLDTDPGPAEVAYLDVWTPPIARRVERLRAQGTRVSHLGDLLLERWRGPSIGITGTAGKTSTTGLVAAILHEAAIDIAASGGARAGNLWPTGDLLERLQAGADATDSTVLLLELTSSHLACCSHSPTLAAVISFWPDHLELHGSLEAYRTAKETIVRHQRPGDAVVVNADDASAGFASSSSAVKSEFSLRDRVDRGAFLDPTGAIVIVDGASETVIGRPRATGPRLSNVVAAAAIAATAGAPADAVERGIRSFRAPRWRAEAAGSLGGIPVVDDGMAATPRKAAATISAYGDNSVILIAGGMNDAGGGPVHATTEERPLLDLACDEIARAARVVVVFGAAGPRLAALLRNRGVEPIEVAGLEEAVAVAAEHATRTEAEAVLFSPLFPLSMGDRERFAMLVGRVG